MPGHDIIVVGASAGGIEVLKELARGLPKGLPAAMFVVCHFPTEWRSTLPDILSRSGPLLAQHARDGEAPYPGQIYVAPPGHHLLLDDGRMRLTRGPRENGHRPAIDPTFRSAARAYGPRVIGVVLTGSLTDGTAGLMAIRAGGGIAVVQDPADALVASMPRSAAEIAGADHIVPAAGLAPLLSGLVWRPVPQPGGTPMDPLEKMTNVVDDDMREQERGGRRGHLATFTCPECGGNLWQVDEHSVLRFRCHVGHAYYAEALLGEQSEALEAALWTAVRTFREKAVLSRQLARAEHERGNGETARRYAEQAELADRYGELIRQNVLHCVSSAGEPTALEGPEEAPAPGPPAAPLQT
jgi:two-component system chemotaxis response regulator CheB